MSRHLIAAGRFTAGMAPRLDLNPFPTRTCAPVPGECGQRTEQHRSLTRAPERKEEIPA
jgi:hypothetical protein